MTDIYVLSYAVECSEGRRPVARAETEFFRDRCAFDARIGELEAAGTGPLRKVRLELVAMPGTGVVDNFVARDYDGRH